MEFETAFRALEAQFITLGTFDMTANRTLLRGISSRHIIYLLALQLCFVGQEGLQLFPTPATQTFVERLSKSFLGFDGQFLKHEDIVGKSHNSLRDAMIAVTSPTVFPSAEPAKQATSGPCAFSLQSSLEVSVLPFDSPVLFGVYEGIIRENSNVLNSSVYAQDSAACGGRLRLYIEHGNDKPLIFAGFVLQFTGRFKIFPISICEWVMDERNFDSSLCCGEFDSCSCVGAGVSVVSDGWEPMRFRLFGVPLSFGLGFDGLQNFRCFATARADQLRLESSFVSDCAVGGMVKTRTGSNTFLKSQIKNSRQRKLVLLECFHQYRSLLRSGIEFEFAC